MEDKPAENAPPAGDGQPDPAGASTDTPPPSGAAAAAPAPVADPGQPQGDAQSEDDSLTDEQVLQAMRDPRAAALISFVTGEEPQAPAAPSAAPAGEDFRTRVARLAEEGDVDGIKTATAEEAQRVKAEAETGEASKKAVAEAERQVLSELAKVPELQDLNATQQLRLINALKQGTASFVAAAGQVIAEKQGAGQRSPEERAAAAAAVGAANQAGATPDLPAGSPVVEGPVIPEGEAAKSKSGYDVLSEFFSYEDAQSGATPSI